MRNYPTDNDPRRRHADEGREEVRNTVRELLDNSRTTLVKQPPRAKLGVVVAGSLGLMPGMKVRK